MSEICWLHYETHSVQWSCAAPFFLLHITVNMCPQHNHCQSLLLLIHVRANRVPVLPASSPQSWVCTNHISQLSTAPVSSYRISLGKRLVTFREWGWGWGGWGKGGHEASKQSKPAKDSIICIISKAKQTCAIFLLDFLVFTWDAYKLFNNHN